LRLLPASNELLNCCFASAAKFFRRSLYISYQLHGFSEFFQLLSRSHRCFLRKPRRRSRTDSAVHSPALAACQSPAWPRLPVKGASFIPMRARVACDTGGVRLCFVYLCDVQHTRVYTRADIGQQVYCPALTSVGEHDLRVITNTTDAVCVLVRQLHLLR